MLCFTKVFGAANDSSIHSIKIDVIDIKLHAVNYIDLLENNSLTFLSLKKPWKLLINSLMSFCEPNRVETAFISLHNINTESVFRNILVLSITIFKVSLIFVSYGSELYFSLRMEHHLKHHYKWNFRRRVWFLRSACPLTYVVFLPVKRKFMQYLWWEQYFKPSKWNALAYYIDIHSPVYFKYILSNNCVKVGISKTRDSYVYIGDANLKCALWIFKQ